MDTCNRCPKFIAETPPVRECRGWRVGDRIWDCHAPDPTFATVDRLVDWPGDCATARRDGDNDSFSLQCARITGWRRVEERPP